MKQYKFLTRFLISAFVHYLAWFFLYESWLKPMGIPDRHLTQTTASVAEAVLGVFGYELETYHKASMSILYMLDKPLIGIAHECNALILFALFTGFIISFPGSWLRKLWYIPAGMLAIWVVNIGRVTALTLIQIHYPSAMAFNHKYTFTILVYAFIFGLWMLWVKMFANKPAPVYEASDPKAIVI